MSSNARLLLIAVLLLTGGILLTLKLTSPASTERVVEADPSKIAQRATFTTYVPEKGSGYSIVPSTLAFDAKSKVFSYTAIIDKVRVKVNQQAQPDVFTVPGANVSLYEKLLEKMNQYGELTTNLGVVTLTRPEELDGGQAAVINEGGTLMFAQPEKDLSDTQWSGFFDSLRKQQ